MLILFYINEILFLQNQKKEDKEKKKNMRWMDENDYTL